MNTRELTNAIKQKAVEIGFTKAGVTSVDAFDREADFFESWVAGGAHGTMQWLERNHDKRRDVRAIMPDAKSILSLALNYYDRTEIDSHSDHKISRYAWGIDYHEVIPLMLAHLLDEIKHLAPGTEGRYYTDTGPLLEKAIAARAGVGWLGKHTNIITQEHGSWVFLAEIILNIPLEPDAPVEDRCGTCTRCIDACPTNAIVEPYVLDAARCISYLTIELKPEHEIKDTLAKDMNGWLYGCDICQDVCPWNRFAVQTDISEFAPRTENLTLTRETIENMEQPEFSRRFQHSPVKRTKLAGLKRNLRAIKNN
jgi:epoxyqueuosine reductase